ncbi:hypothetical protein BDZ88DRAFT_434932 [Geranomyces variabilis]|nr:hypothetical protein BDZ88DRAFT_434932 [Geranomyces variabilis]KAJ3134985.1 hypothetical protein HDU90_004310 [Geranomyces variabilis]
MACVGSRSLLYIASSTSVLGADLTIRFESTDCSTSEALHVQCKLDLGDSPLTANLWTSCHQLAGLDKAALQQGQAATRLLPDHKLTG